MNAKGLINDVVPNHITCEQKNEGFIIYPTHRLFIMEPDFTESAYIDLSSLRDYLDIGHLDSILPAILIFADREVLSTKEVEQVFDLEDESIPSDPESFYHYTDDLPYILQLVRHHRYKEDGLMLLEKDEHSIREVIQRIHMFRRAYEYDNTYLPLGYYTQLYTNLATFFYIYELDMNETQDIQIQKHHDIDRPVRQAQNRPVNDYSVMYNPLTNKMFLWDFSHEHIAKLS